MKYKKFNSSIEELATSPLDDKIFRKIFSEYLVTHEADVSASDLIADLMGDALGIAEVKFEGAASAMLTKQIDAVKSPSLSKKEMMRLVLEECQRWSKVPLSVLGRRFSWAGITPKETP